MKRKRIISGLVITLGLLASCNKSEVIVAPNSNVSAHFDNYLASITQTFTVDANSVTTLTGEHGTKIYLTGNHFTDISGNPITGNVDLSLVEIYSKTQMILANKATAAYQNGQIVPISSGGEFKITASQNGSEIIIANPFQVVTTTNLDPSVNMQLFSGEIMEGDMIWSPSNDSIGIVSDTTGQNYFYGFPFDGSYNWINCDYFWNNPSNMTEVNVITPAYCNDMNTQVYLVFTDENALLNMYLYNDSFRAYNIPEGYNVTFVVVTDYEGQLQYGTLNSTITTNLVETIPSLTDVESMEELEDILDGIL